MEITPLTTPLLRYAPPPSVAAGALLIGGHALAQLGSARHTDDVDYLILDPASSEAFLHDQAGNVDYVNANGHPFFRAVWAAEAGNKSGRATPQSLAELKAFALVQHALHRQFQKADDAEYDLKFLVRNWQVQALKIAPRFLSTGELAEVTKIIAGTRK